jgi:prolactin regulatory element-binding protein
MSPYQKFSEVAADCSIPAYCIKTLGSRHVIIGGGGGSAKTGILNKLEVIKLFFFIIYFNLLIALPSYIWNWI